MFRIPTPIILIVGLTAATCVIAYWSDNLGKKLGKKRISLQIGSFSLRPRQTATLITMISSVGIMLATLAAMTLFSDQVKTAIFRSQRLNKSNEDLLHRNALLAKESQRLRASVAGSNVQAQQAEKLAQAATQKANAATKNADLRVAAAGAKTVQAEKQFRNAQSKLGPAQAARAAAERGEKQAHQSERIARRDEKTARARAQEIVQRLSQAQNLLAVARNRVTSAQARLSAVNSRLAGAQAGVRRAQNAIEQVKRGTKEVLKSNRTLLVQLETGRASVKALQDERVKLETEVGQAKQYLTQFASIADYYRNAAGNLSSGRVIIEVGQVFAEILVPRDAGKAELRAALSRLLDEGAAAATKLGAPPPADPAAAPTGTARALHLEPLPAAILGGDAQSDALLGEEQIVDHFVNYISISFKVPVSVRLTASRRYVEGETQFEARLVPVPVEQAFKRGAMLAEGTVDGTQNDARIFNQLLALVNRAGATARAKGMIPLLSEENPDFFAAGTNERIFDTLRKVKSLDSKTRVRLVADDDLLTIDNPSVRFQIDSGT